MDPSFSALQSLLQGSPLDAVLGFGLFVLWRAMEKKDKLLLDLTTRAIEALHENTRQIHGVTEAIRENRCKMDDNPFTKTGGRNGR